VKLGPGGRPFHGDKGLNANWYDFGTEVLAVADATVSAAHDGIPENEPSDIRAVPITLDTVGGNYLILDLGAGRYALYAHLQPGSARVKVGDKVHRGQVLALLGNTGNSDAPHLHFHIADTNSPLGAEGLPYSFAA
jgi:murein DD-endopeptidase